MSRMEILSLTTLVSAADGGGYTLPEELLAAYRTYTRVKETELAAPARLDTETAAARLVAAVVGGEDPDLLAIGREVNDSTAALQVYDHAQQVLRLAVEQAGERATFLAGDLTERIIVEHLRPAFQQVHAEAREVAQALQGYGLDPHALVTAPAKVRTAYGSLPFLVARRSIILTARRLVNTAGHRTPQHDVSGYFADFAEPLAFNSWWRLPAALPRVPAPEDPMEHLLWVVSDAAAPGKPWLPTVAEQDAAWWALLGEAAPQAQAAQFARTLAGH